MTGLFWKGQEAKNKLGFLWKGKQSQENWCEEKSMKSKESTCYFPVSSQTIFCTVHIL